MKIRINSIHDIIQPCLFQTGNRDHLTIMNHHLRLSFLVILLSIIFYGCQPTPPTRQYSFTYLVSEKINFIIETDHLAVSIQPGEDGQVVISYDDLPGELQQISIEDQDGTFTISSPTKLPARSMQIWLPPQSQFTLQAFNMNITINDLAGEMDIQTIAGDIQASNLSGQIRLKSARGDVTLKDSLGNLSVLGEHGTLTLAANHGTVNAANVVGGIRYSGQIMEGDEVFLETDRGTVDAILVDSNDASINVWTANGSVSCMVDQIEMTSVTCKRTPALPQGKFQIKTVWGAIQVKTQ